MMRIKRFESTPNKSCCQRAQRTRACAMMPLFGGELSRSAYIHLDGEISRSITCKYMRAREKGRSLSSSRGGVPSDHREGGERRRAEERGQRVGRERVWPRRGWRCARGSARLSEEPSRRLDQGFFLSSILGRNLVRGGVARVSQALAPEHRKPPEAPVASPLRERSNDVCRRSNALSRRRRRRSRRSA